MEIDVDFIQIIVYATPALLRDRTFGRRAFGRRTFDRRAFGRMDIWTNELWPIGHLAECQ